MNDFECKTKVPMNVNTTVCWCGQTIYPSVIDCTLINFVQDVHTHTNLEQFFFSRAHHAFVDK